MIRASKIKAFFSAKWKIAVHTFLREYNYWRVKPAERRYLSNSRAISPFDVRTFRTIAQNCG